jgi:hypothetical protein
VIEEGDGIEGLVLCRCGDLTDLCQMGEEQVHIRGSHFQRMSLIVKDDKSLDPIGICFNGAGAQVAESRSCSDLVEEFRFVHRGLLLLDDLCSLSLSGALQHCDNAAQSPLVEGYMQIYYT